MKKNIFFIFIIYFIFINADWNLYNNISIGNNIPVLQEYVKDNWSKFLDFNLNAIYYFSGLNNINNISSDGKKIFISKENKLYIIDKYSIVDSMEIPFGAKATIGKNKNQIYYILNNSLYLKYKKNTNYICDIDSNTYISGYGNNIYIYSNEKNYKLENKKLIEINKNGYPVIVKNKKYFIDLEKGFIGVGFTNNMYIYASRDGLYYKYREFKNEEEFHFPYGSSFIISDSCLYIKTIDNEFYDLKNNKVKIENYRDPTLLPTVKDTLIIDENKYYIPLLKQAVRLNNNIYVILWDGNIYKYENNYFVILNNIKHKFSKNQFMYYPVKTQEGKDILDYIGEKISTSDKKYYDEIYFTLSFLPFRVIQAMYRLNSLDIIFDNPKYIYQIADSLKYVSIKENNNFTTLIYNDTFELDDSIYYQCIVMPMIIHEIPSYIDTSIVNHFNSINDSTNFYTGKGVFWREYFTKDTSYSKSFYDLAKNETNIDSVVHKIHRFTNYKTGFMDFGYKTRDIQPIVIYKKHYGSCGEHSAFSTAILRTLLIPAWPVGSHGEDHVWAEYYNHGKWIHWDLSSDEKSAFDNPQAEDMNGKGITNIFAFVYPGKIVDRTPYYRDYEKIILNNYTGEDIYMLSNWNNSKALAFWTHTNPKDIILTGYQKKGVFLETDSKIFYFPIDTTLTIQLDKNNNIQEKGFYISYCPITKNFVNNRFLKDSIGYTGTNLILKRGYDNNYILYFENPKSISIDAKKDLNINDSIIIKIRSNNNGKKYVHYNIDNKVYFPIDSINIIKLLQLGNGEKHIVYNNNEFKANIKFSNIHKRIKVYQDDPNNPYNAKYIFGPFDVNSGMFFVKTENGINGNDVDIFLIRDENNNGILEKGIDKEIGKSTTPTNNETIGEYVDKGKYFIIIQGWSIKTNYDECDLWILIENTNKE